MLLGLKSFKSKHNSKGIYAKNKLSVIKLKTLVSANEMVNKIIKYILAI